MSNPPPAHAVAVLRGLAEDYARMLREHGNATTSGIVSGVAKEAADSLVLYLRSEKAKPVGDTDIFPSTLPHAGSAD